MSFTESIFFAMTFELFSLGLKVENATAGLLNITSGDASRESGLLKISKVALDGTTHLMSSKLQDYRPWNRAFQFIILSILFVRRWTDLRKAPGGLTRTL
jgi:hypothetical protein